MVLACVLLIVWMVDFIFVIIKCPFYDLKTILAGLNAFRHELRLLNKYLSRGDTEAGPEGGLPLKLRHDIRVHVCMRWLRKHRLLVQEGCDSDNLESILPHEIVDSPRDTDLAQQVGGQRYCAFFVLLFFVGC